VVYFTEGLVGRSGAVGVRGGFLDEVGREAHLAFVSSARRLASRCVAALWRSVLARRRASRRLYRLALLFLWHPDLAPLVEVIRVVTR
jgi:hypothetical protein